MATISWSEHAGNDLEDIYDYIARDSFIYARYQVERILDAIERLPLYPDSGRDLPEFPSLPHRDLIVGQYRVVYRYDSQKETVYIVTIIHGRRLLPAKVVEKE